MRIEKGIVKDQGYPDYELTYGIMDDGSQYYFINDGMLDNGNFIASIVLKEAIGHANNTKLGLINNKGDVLLPFEYKVIKVIDKKYLLVEKNIPTNKNVLDAISVKHDPLAATKLVTNAASLKEKIVSSMKPLGRFLFNDQFSEATIFDIDGNNIVNNEYFSFIGTDEDGFVFSKNTMDSELVKYNFNGKVDEKTVEEEVEVPLNHELDVMNMNINTEEINEALEVATEEEKSLVDENTMVDLGLNQLVEEVNSITPDLGLANTVVADAIVDIGLTDINSDINAEVNEEVKFDIGDTNVVEEEIPKDSSVNTVSEDSYLNIEKDSIIEDVGSTMKRLIEQNKSQRSSIIAKDEEITNLRDDNRELHDLCTKQTRELSSFKDKIMKFENIVSKLDGRNQMISAQLEDLEKENNYLEEQLNILKPQIAGKETLVTLLDEANETLNI